MFTVAKNAPFFISHCRRQLVYFRNKFSNVVSLRSQNRSHETENRSHETQFASHIRPRKIPLGRARNHCNRTFFDTIADYCINFPVVLVDN